MTHAQKPLRKSVAKLKFAVSPLSAAVQPCCVGMASEQARVAATQPTASEDDALAAATNHGEQATAHVSAVNLS